MSVVNQMLLELDRRRASATERAALPGMVRALPPDMRPPIRWLLAAGGALLIVAGVAAAWMVQGRTAPASQPVTDVAQAAAPATQAFVAGTEPQLKRADLLASVPQGGEARTSPALRPYPDPLATAEEGRASGNANSTGSPDALQRTVEDRVGRVSPPEIHDHPPRAGEGKGGGKAASAAASSAETGEVVIDKRPAENAQQVRLATLDAAATIAAALRDARALAQRGEVGAAAELLKRHASAGVGNAEYRGLHAAVLQRLTLHAEAAEEYRAALRLSPDAAVWWLGLGISLEALGRGGEAREAFERARAGHLSAELAAFADQRIQALR